MATRNPAGPTMFAGGLVENVLSTEMAGRHGRSRGIGPRRGVLPGGVLVVAICLRLSTPELANISYLVLAVYAVMGRGRAIQALALSWLFTMLNPAIAPDPTAATTWRYVVIASAATSVLLRSGLAKGRMQASASVLATLLLGAFIVVHAILFSPIPSVSILKAVAWTVCVSALLAAWRGLSTQSRARLESQIVGGLIAVMALSLPLLPTSAGYLRNGRGFQGILTHPQTFGVTMALLGAWLVGGLLGNANPSWKRLTVLGTCLVLIVLSEARTAGFALIAGIGLAVPISFLSARMPIRRLMPGISNRRMRLTMLVGGAALALVAPLLTHELHDYVQKSGDSASFIDIYDQSRGALIAAMLRNIHAHPIRGIGFGIASDPISMAVDRDQLLGVPVGASIEKGVMPLAVLEELGIPGLLVVTGWLLLLARRAAYGGLTASLVIWTALFTNMGESTFFSPGGMGLLVLILVCWAGTMRPSLHTRSWCRA